MRHLRKSFPIKANLKLNFLKQFLLENIFLLNERLVVAVRNGMFTLGPQEGMMLDSYIIDRIRREKEIIREQEALVPLRIHVPDERTEPPKADRTEKSDRGSAEIDFQL